MKRIPSRELLDDDAGTATEIADNLLDIYRMNRYLGGVTTTVRMIGRVARLSGKTEFTVLDVAAGSGETAECTRARLERQGIAVHFLPLDRLVGHFKPGIKGVGGDAVSLPFRDGSFDLVTSCLLVHQLAPADVMRFIKESLRCSRIAVLVNDLIRDPFHLAAAHAGRLIYRSRMTANDAPASVRQAYTAKELRNMLGEAGADRVEIFRNHFYRVGAIVWNRPSLGLHADPRSAAFRKPPAPIDLHV